MSIFSKIKKNNTPIIRADEEGANAIGTKQIEEATRILQKYKEGKSSVENRVIENDKWYRLRHWECMEHSEQQVQPTSAWLFNAIANKHADAMDNMPAPNLLPREQSDVKEAELLSSIIPVVLQQCNFEQTYSDVWDNKLIGGTGIYGITWDATKLNGLGDISISCVDILSLFWEPGVTDIQASQNLFRTELVDNKKLEQIYPQTRGRLGGKTITVSEYAHDEKIDTSDKSCVVDWYYKRNSNGKTVLHYVKFVNDIVLYATENETQPITNEAGEYIAPAPAEVGIYNHGKYPFVFDPLFRVKGSPAGIGYVDIGRPAQEYIDRGNQAILKNTLSNATPRYFIREGGEVNEKEFADITNEFIHVKGANLGDDSIRPVQMNTLSGNFVEVIHNKIEELKETMGNRDISTGGTTSGVTAASAIAAMQEAGSKLSRDMIKASYRAYRTIIEFVIEIIRQFYNAPRSFRIVGESGAAEFVSYTNRGVAPFEQGSAFGTDMGIYAPLFDIEITAEKASPYSRMAQNELMLHLYQLGVFNPQLADQAALLLSAMDFDRKNDLMQKISQNGSMLQQMMALAQMVDAMRPPKANQPGVAQSIAMQYGIQIPQSNAQVKSNTEESSTTKKAREQTAEMTTPR